MLHPSNSKHSLFVVTASEARQGQKKKLQHIAPTRITTKKETEEMPKGREQFCPKGYLSASFLKESKLHEGRNTVEGRLLKNFLKGTKR